MADYLPATVDGSCCAGCILDRLAADQPLVEPHQPHEGVGAQADEEKASRIGEFSIRIWL